VNRFAALAVPLFVAATALSAAPPVQAQAVDSSTRSAARQLGTEGVQAYEAGRYDEASDKLERAYQLLKAPSLALWSGRALEKRGQLVDASERYLEGTRLPIEGTDDKSVQEKAKKDAQTAHDALEPRIPRMLIEVHGATSSDVHLTIGGAAVPSAVIGTPIPIDPKRIEVRAEHQGHTVRADVSITEGSSAKVILRFHGNESSAEVTTTSGSAASPESTEAAASTASAGTPTDPPRDEGPRTPGPNLVGPIVLLASGAVLAGIGVGLIVASNSCDYYYYCEQDGGMLAAGGVLTAVGLGAAAGGGIWLGIKVSRHKKAAPAPAPSAALTLVPVRAGLGLGFAGTF